MKRNIHFCWLPVVILWMILIFLFSSQPAEESEEVSLSIGRAISSVVVENYNELSMEEQEEIARKVDFPLRKMAHATEYAILALLLWFVTRHCLPAFLITVVYAATDEFHQLFVAGRSARVMDVAIDAAGAVVMLFIVWLVSRKK